MAQHRQETKQCMQHIQFQAGMAQEQLRACYAAMAMHPQPFNPALPADPVNMPPVSMTTPSVQPVSTKCLHGELVPPSDFVAPLSPMVPPPSSSWSQPPFSLPMSLPMPPSSHQVPSSGRQPNSSISPRGTSQADPPSTLGPPMAPSTLYSELGYSNGTQALPDTHLLPETHPWPDTLFSDVTFSSLGSLPEGTAVPPPLPLPTPSTLSWSSDLPSNRPARRPPPSISPTQSRTADTMSPGIPISPLSPWNGVHRQVNAIGCERTVHPAPPPGLAKSRPALNNAAASRDNASVNGVWPLPKVSSTANDTSTPSWPVTQPVSQVAPSRLNNGVDLGRSPSPLQLPLGSHDSSKDSLTVTSTSSAPKSRKSVLSPDAAPWPQPGDESAFGGIGMTWILVEDVPAEVGCSQYCSLGL